MKSSEPSQKQGVWTLPSQVGGLAVSHQMPWRNRAAERNGGSDVWTGGRERRTGRTNTMEDLKAIKTLMACGRTSSSLGRCVEFGTPETPCSRLPSRQTLIRQWDGFPKAVPEAHVHNPAKNWGEPLYTVQHRGPAGALSTP